MSTSAPQPSPAATLAPPRDAARPATAPLAGIVALALALALAAMWQRPLLDDEVGSLRAVALSYPELFTTFDEWITQPGFFLVAKPIAALLGPGPLAIRLPSLLAAALGLVALALLGARLLGARVGLLAALLLALQPFHLFYSQMGRGYALAAASVTLSLLLLHSIARGAGARVGAAYVAVRALGVYAHLGACGSGLAELAIAFGAARAEGTRALRRTLGWMTLAALLSALLYLPLLDDLLRFRQRWSGSGGFGLGFLPLVLDAYAGGRGVPILVWSACVVGGTLAAWRRKRLAGWVLLLWPLGILAFYALQQTAHYPWAFSRFLFPALPAFALAVACALDALARVVAHGSVPRRRIVLALLVGALLLLTASKTPRIAFGPRDPDWSAVIAHLEAAGLDPANAIVLPLRTNAFFHYVEEREGREPQRLRALLRSEGLAGLTGRRLAFLVDLAPFDAAEWSDRFEVRRFGASTLLLTRDDLPRTRAAAVAATRAVVEHWVTWLETLPRAPIREDWVYWRLDPRHEHAFIPEPELLSAWGVLRALAQVQGDEETARRAGLRVMALQDALLRPAEVGASWSLLAPGWTPGR